MIEFPVPDAKTPADALTRAEAFIREFQKDDLITPAVAPHCGVHPRRRDADRVA